ncbi:hydroxymethylglutaryl-CoA lyase [Alicyclobacillus macrosporangiidus]|uniref:Hydroxymethylglutaryl-CoA lyase n=1 Tax=Alicyclobacillus macrosporangiidus TaxID=392015 RepID=A0A1I7HBA6_9BACL|nr:hydroxymethylglutaryl-CoA lyase [Alicyclobacillus macrosporangiidus]SFU57998.1 hydroxymethylglutaryl-CoA lyase [Alicyclobacillus macrosporangiidus]
MNLPEAVCLYEVGPRDGLQNEARPVPAEVKVELVDRLAAAGFRSIEVTSFVHPKWIPQLADADEVMRRIERRPGVVYSALVPNERGLERALQAGVGGVNVFLSASETHNRKNINKSISDTYPVLAPVISGAKAAGLPVRGYVSTAFGCPYEGRVAVDQVVGIACRLLELGVDELSIGDTIGVAVPTQVMAVVSALAREVPLHRVALHFHDTYGTALANIVAGMTAGVRRFDASAGGLGGCPYAPGATGNVATEDVVYLLHRMGVSTGVDEAALAETTRWLEQALGKALASHASAVRRGQAARAAGAGGDQEVAGRG